MASSHSACHLTPIKGLGSFSVSHTVFCFDPFETAVLRCGCGFSPLRMNRPERQSDLCLGHTPSGCGGEATSSLEAGRFPARRNIPESSAGALPSMCDLRAAGRGEHHGRSGSPGITGPKFLPVVGPGNLLPLTELP